MTKGEGKGKVIDLKGLLARNEDFVRAAVEALVQAALEAEMTEAIGAAKGERSETRIRGVRRRSLPRCHRGASVERQYEEQRGKASMQAHCTEIGSIGLG